jgi:hypothetical protein
MNHLGLMPEYINSIADLILQSYKGHVTISPKPTLYDYKMLIYDVRPEDFDYVLQHTYSQTI